MFADIHVIVKTRQSSFNHLDAHVKHWTNGICGSKDARKPPEFVAANLFWPPELAEFLPDWASASHFPLSQCVVRAAIFPQTDDE